MIFTALPIEQYLPVRTGWLIRLRWIAAAIVGLIAAAAPAAAGLPSGPFLLLALTMFTYNTVFLLTRRHISPRLGVHLQVVSDWLALALLCHLTGGLSSPFLFFFVFHVILTAMLTSRRGCFGQAGFAVGLVAGMAAMDASGWWPAYRPDGLGPAFPAVGDIALLVFLGSFSTVILCSAYLATTVVRQLRLRERQQLALQEDLRRSNRELVEMDQARTSFVNMVAHEIRGPLSAVRSMLRVALDGYTGPVEGRLHDLMTRSDRRLVQLQDLVNELLDLVRGGQLSPAASMADIDIADSITQIVTDMDSRAREKGIALRLEPPPAGTVFRGDQQDLERIFQNLIGNAIRYTPAGGQVTVTAQVAPDQRLHFEVCDTGIGIPAEDLPRVFNEFFRATNAKRTVKNGTGLGLSIVRKTAVKYGGEVTVTSELGQGSCFSVFLPVSLPSPRPAPSN